MSDTDVKRSPIVSEQDPWFAKSSYSGAGNDCVELTHDRKLFRDSKNPAALLPVSSEAGNLLFEFVAQ